MAWNNFCDGVRRRDFLKVGALGGLGLSLADYLQLARAGAVSPKARAKAAIYIRLGGGPTHMDTFDMKPDAPEEYRGELKPIKSKVPGMEFCELMPKLAQCADKFAILRGVSHTLAAHELGTKYMNTGNRPIPSLEYAGIGAIVSKELGAPQDLPAFVAVPNTPQTGGYLGIQYGPFNTSASPRLGEPFTVRGISLRSGLTLADVQRREQLLAKLDRHFQAVERDVDLLSGLDQFAERAQAMISSPKAREAFDTSKEPRAVAERFGANELGQSCLLATRLVEAGVPFVTVNTGRWDMHQAIFDNLDRALPELDAALAGLFTTLYERGLLDSTAVIVSGEFGRTPKVNQRGGRDHWPRAMFVLMAGGGVKGGQVIGASDAKGEGPAADAIVPDNVIASLYHMLGIDHHTEYQTSTGRPIMIVRDGHVMPELFG